MDAAIMLVFWIVMVCCAGGIAFSAIREEARRRRAPRVDYSRIDDEI